MKTKSEERVMKKCSKCDVEISGTGKTGLCLPCVNKIYNPRVLPERYCEECGKKLYRKRNKSGLCNTHSLIKRNKNPDFIKKVSAGVANSYTDNPELRKKRGKIGKAFGFGKPAFRAGMEREGFWRKQKDIPDFERYREIVRDITDKNYQENFYEIPNAKKRSREFHLDHKVSIAYGFDNNIPAYIIGHHKNLEVIHHAKNESKHANNSITLEKLFAEIDK